MKDESYVPPEAVAYQAFLHWIDEGKRVWRLFEDEGMPVPQTLKHALTDVTKTGTGANRPQPARLRLPDKPLTPPPTVRDDWLWIDAGEATVRTVVLAILAEGKIFPVRELVNRVKEILPDAHEGSIANIGTSLSGKFIERTGEGWKLKQNMDAPLLYKGYIWAPADLFQKYDLAAFRRMAIRHLLATSQDGLQVMQIYRQLKSADWLNTPLSKDLVKADLFIMQSEGRVRRFGSQRKWTLKAND